MDFQELLTRITPPEEAAREAARRRWDSRAKPLGSLGLLESALEDIAALTGSPELDLGEKAVYVFCGDHGVVAQGVTQCGQEVTARAAVQLGQGRTAVCRMARRIGCRVVPVDMGIADFPGCQGVLERRVGSGTADFTQGPAMEREQALQALLIGAELAREEALRGTRLLAAGEMGIGNTTSAAALASVLLPCPPEEVCSRGAGLSDAGLERKLEALRRGLAVNRPDPRDPLEVLSKLGGFELLGMCGLFLGGAAYRVPVLIDGFLSAVAALCALRLCPGSRKAMLASHVSPVPGGQKVLEALGVLPLISAQMRLGEGSGAVAAMPLLEMALAVYQECYSFQEGGIPPYTPQ